jgi:predicted ATPase/DNA-binding NarL/FixJ family response regulator
VPSPDQPDQQEALSGGGPPPRRRSVRGALPTQLSHFVGRRREIAQVKQLMRDAQLVTLTGGGGVGKTRLALRVAAEVRRTFADGAWFVDLTRVQDSDLPGPEIRDPDVIAHLVLAALQVPQRGGGSPVESLTGYLLDRQVLLVLDNCEHVTPACAALVDQLLGAAAGVRVLATSREPLAVGGEALYSVPTLPIPAPDRRLTLEELAKYESVALFLARAQAVLPGFVLTDRNRKPVAELCRQVDGLPLAIELAAARVPVLTPQQILDRVSDRFALLSRGRRDAPARQRTLRACVEWSFELCSKPERLLWARSSVFVGGFDAEAVERVCCDERLPAPDLADVLAALVDKSIVGRVAAEALGGPDRYRLLETLREFGREQLVEADEQAALRARHRDWCQQLTARASAEEISHRQPYWRARLTEEHPNLRAAIEFCLTNGEAETVFQIMEPLPRGFWVSGGVVSEGLSWLDRALAQARAPTVARARALVQAAGLALYRRDLDTMTARLEEAERLARRLGDPYSLALAGYTRSVAGLQRNDLTSATELAEQGLNHLSGGAEPNLSLRLHLLLQVLWSTAMVGDHERSRQCYREIQLITESRGEVAARSAALLGIGQVAWRAGQTEEADRYARESLRIKQATRTTDLFIGGQTIELLAWTAAAQQQYRRAATLLGAANSALTDRGTPISALKALTADHADCERQIRDALDNATFRSAFGYGRTLSIDDAVEYALEQPHDSRTPTTAPETSTRLTVLTPREQQVAHLIGQGLSNQEIAGKLVISSRTAEGHVQSILTKLGFTSRTQVTAWISNSET